MIVGLNQRAREEGLQQGIEQGIERGIEQGVRQGRAEGERAVLERLLFRRFGELPPRVGARLGGAAEAELEAWADNVLDAATLDEVFEPRRG